MKKCKACVSCHKTHEFTYLGIYKCVCMLIKKDVTLYVHEASSHENCPRNKVSK